MSPMTIGVIGILILVGLMAARVPIAFCFSPPWAHLAGSSNGERISSGHPAFFD